MPTVLASLAMLTLCTLSKGMQIIRNGTGCSALLNCLYADFSLTFYFTYLLNYNLEKNLCINMILDYSVDESHKEDSHTDFMYPLIVTYHQRKHHGEHD